MKQKASIREIKLNVENEFVLNLVTYLIQREQYVFVGNETEIWLENLNHPKVQLIYINSSKTMTAVHANYIFHKIGIISKQIKRKFLMMSVRSLILNTCDIDQNVKDNEHYDMIINVENVEEAHQNEVLTSLFPQIKDADLNKNMYDIAVFLQAQTKRQAINEVNARAAKKAKFKIMPIITYGYVAILLVIFAYLWYRTQTLPAAFVAVHYGSTYNPLIMAGEYWRLLASSFMHLDLMHVAFNAMFIFRFGAMIENIFGKWRLLFIILISAIMSGLFGFALSTNFSLGASGVAYGFIGASVFLGFELRKTFMPILRQVIIPMLIISVAFSLFMPNIDHFGHLGGFIGGFLSAAIISVPNVKPFIFRMVITTITLGVLISGLWINGVRLTENHDFTGLNRAIIWQYLELGDVERADHLIDIFFGETE